MNWINVKDKSKMPDEDGWYWVTIKDYFFNCEKAVEAEYKNGIWYDHNHLKLDVVAWYSVKKPAPYGELVDDKKPDLIEQILSNSEAINKESTDHLLKWFKERQEKMTLVQNDTYKDWLYEYTSTNGTFCDDSLLYSEEDNNRENSMLLSYFMSYIESLENATYYDEDGWEHYVFKLKDKYFDICTICGQGAFTVIKECKQNDKAIILN